MCHDPKKICNPGSAESKIWLGILDLKLLFLSWDLKNLEYQNCIGCGILRIQDLKMLICHRILGILDLKTFRYSCCIL